jgi:hypothetical protein
VQEAALMDELYETLNQREAELNSLERSLEAREATVAATEAAGGEAESAESAALMDELYETLNQREAELSERERSVEAREAAVAQVSWVCRTALNIIIMPCSGVICWCRIIILLRWRHGARHRERRVGQCGTVVRPIRWNDKLTQHSGLDSGLSPVSNALLRSGPSLYITCI